MEQPPRKISCSLSQSLQRCRASKDRFSSLPDGIAHYILSFLSMKDKSRFSIVSKRCRELFISAPSFTFDCMQYVFDSLKRVQLMNFFDNYMLQRKGMEISSFCVRCYYQNRICYEEYRVLTWLRQALRCSADMIDLELILDSGGTFVMPLGIFSCNTLRILKVDLHGGILKLPSSDGFTHIQSLSLKRVKIIAECFGEWISSSCKFLAELFLEHVSGVKNLSITSSSVKYIAITSYHPSDLCHLNVSAHMLQEFFIVWKFDSSLRRSLKIYAPNLEYLIWDGCTPDLYSLGKLKYLKEFTTYLIPPYGSTGTQNFVELVRHIEGIKCLTICADLVKAWFDQGCLPISCDNLHTIHIYFRCSDSLDKNLVPALASLLRGLPNLKTIFLRTWPPSTSNINMSEVTNLSPTKASGLHTGFWESQDLIFVNKLEEVEIELIKGVIEVQEIKYLLKHAKELKKMVIFYSPPLPSNFGEMVNELKMASTAIIDVRPNYS